jgi:hypothetical protein
MKNKELLANHPFTRILRRRKTNAIIMIALVGGDVNAGHFYSGHSGKVI